MEFLAVVVAWISMILPVCCKRSCILWMVLLVLVLALLLLCPRIVSWLRKCHRNILSRIEARLLLVEWQLLWIHGRVKLLLLWIVMG